MDAQGARETDDAAAGAAAAPPGREPEREPEGGPRRTTGGAQAGGLGDPPTTPGPGAPPKAGAPADSTVEPAAEPASGDPRSGIAALSPRYQVGVALALAVVAITVCVHLGMVFLHVAPSNTVTKKHGQVVQDWVYPEFEQNWKLFAPNPLQQNIAVQVRAQTRGADGSSRVTGWYDLSAQDGRAIDGNLLPSHTQQNELRRAWDFFAATHDGDNRATGTRGTLSESYLRRIAVLRLDRAEAAGPGGTIELVQLRARTTNVRPPEWSGERVSLKPVDRVLPWWSVPAAEATGGTDEAAGGNR
jgi:hypothetical protein